MATSPSLIRQLILFFPTGHETSRWRWTGSYRQRPVRQGVKTDVDHFLAIRRVGLKSRITQGVLDEFLIQTKLGFLDPVFRIPEFLSGSNIFQLKPCSHGHGGVCYQVSGAEIRNRRVKKGIHPKELS